MFDLARFVVAFGRRDEPGPVLLVFAISLLAELVPATLVDCLRTSAYGLGTPTTGGEPGPAGAVRS